MDLLDADMLDVPCSPEPAATPTTRRLTAETQKVLDFINDTFTSIIAKLEKPRPPFEEPCVVLNRVVAVDETRAGAGGRGQMGGTTDGKVKSRRVEYEWPGRSEKEAWHFACVLCIFSEIREAILDGRVVTKREIYYRQPELFKKQNVVDRRIDDIAFTCGVSRKELMVSASPKGLICGLSDFERVQTVPLDLEKIVAEDVQHIRWILVIEKEASFNQLVEASFDRASCLGPGLLVTAKGYPDLQTRYFLRHILDVLAQIQPVSVPIVSVFDCDPDGLEIYRCYHSGSKSSTQEPGCHIPEMKLLGVDMCDMVGKRKVMTEAVDLTKRDRARARSMLSRIGVADLRGQGSEMRRMLQTMLMLGKKMEIQAVDRGHSAGLCGWLERKMLEAW